MCGCEHLCLVAQSLSSQLLHHVGGEFGVRLKGQVLVHKGFHACPYGFYVFGGSQGIAAI